MSARSEVSNAWFATMTPSDRNRVRRCYRHVRRSGLDVFWSRGMVLDVVAAGRVSAHLRLGDVATGRKAHPENFMVAPR